MNIIESKINTDSREFSDNYIAMQGLVKTLRNKVERLQHAGSKKAIKKFLDNNKILPRERINKLCDKNSFFLEVAPFAADNVYDTEVPSAGIICGIGQVCGVNCMIIANDALVKGGAYFPLTVKKHLRAQQIALENKLPCIYLVDSGGANLAYQDEVFPDKEHFGRIFFNQAKMSSANIPQIAVVLGSCTAGGAYVPAMSDHVVMVKEQATIFLAGAPLVKAATGEVVENEELGGSDTHCRISGVADYYAHNDLEALCTARSIVENLKIAVKETSPSYQEPLYPAEELYGILPASYKSPLEIREVIARLVDGSQFLEFKQLYGKTLVCGFAKIHGMQIGIVANNGVLFSESALKGTHFINICCQRKIPLLFLQNVTGFMVGKKFEHEGIAKHGAKMVNAVACANVPKFTIIVGGSFGAGNYGMCGRAYDPRFLWSTPNSAIAVMGGEQASSVLTQIKTRSNPNLTQEQLQQLQTDTLNAYNQQTDCYYSSARLWDDGVLDPINLRQYLAAALQIATQNEILNSNFGIFRM